MMKRLILVRHVETEHNIRGITQGWSDSALSEFGRRQARLVADRLVSFEPSGVYSSTLPRALSTAEAIAERLSLPLVLLDDLREMNCGRWEGLPFTTVRKEDSDYYQRWTADPTVPCPDGESYRDVQERISRALESIAQSGGGKAERPVVVSHGTAIRIAATALLNLPLQAARQLAQENAAINVFERRGDRYILERWNDAAHCREEGK